jgi:hypothetical protein
VLVRLTAGHRSDRAAPLSRWRSPELLAGWERVAPVLSQSSALRAEPGRDGKHPFVCVAADQVSAAFDLLGTAPEHSRAKCSSSTDRAMLASSGELTPQTQ